MTKKPNRCRGSVTIEFVFIIPMIVLMAMFLWQVVIAGMAVISTQSALQDAVRVASITEDVDKARHEAMKTFGNSSNYRLQNFNVNIQGDRAVATANTKIDVIFMSSRTLSYSETAQAPVMK
ncbi:TadE-like protein [Melghirimyces profundicolus]|uniref:TadE-like protein n=1 Tax=Melghirimyces profundicolus TaxID=1242148 RepID=A0A2T6BGT5_9BACL|nr:TadE family protein [Melghirimyces profundicolus]PTX55278.1 TadE-like protein [Melghirimyces profundicolus]